MHLGIKGTATVQSSSLLSDLRMYYFHEKFPNGDVLHRALFSALKL